MNARARVAKPKPLTPADVEQVRRIFREHVPTPGRAVRIGAESVDSPVFSLDYGGSVLNFSADEAPVIAEWLAERVSRGLGFTRELPVAEEPNWICWGWGYRWTRAAFRIVCRADKRWARAAADYATEDKRRTP